MGKDYVTRSKDQRKGDLYHTPFSLVWELLRYESFENCLEPAAGHRAIVNAAKNASRNNFLFQVHYDINDKIPVNFFHKEEWDGDVLTNFPFSNWDDFVIHAKKVCSGKICTIGKTNFLGCKGRYEKGLWEGCSKLYIFNRYVDYRTEYREDGLFYVGNLCTGWFLWEPGYKGNIETIILDVQKYAKLGQYEKTN